jgi:hypothetical protein
VATVKPFTKERRVLLEHFSNNKKIQSSSEYQVSLVFERSKLVWLTNGPDFEWYLNSQPTLVHYSDDYLNTGPVFKWPP